MQSSSGRQRATTSAGPPTMSVNVPATAASAVLPTGLSIIAAPFVAIAAPTLRVVSGSMVLMSMYTEPARIPSAMPSLPSATRSTSGASGSMVMTISLAAATAFGVVATLAPAASSFCIAAACTSCTVSRCPLPRMLRAIGAPIVPSPMKPTSMCARSW
jgi:hypothetical protein